MPTLVLSAQLAALINDQTILDRTEHSLDEICIGLIQDFPALAAQILDAHGKASPFVGVFVDGDQINPISEGHVPLRGDSVITMISAVAGG